jgi:Cell wall-active antibiotics response LiaF, C-terminal
MEAEPPRQAEAPSEGDESQPDEERPSEDTVTSSEESEDRPEAESPDVPSPAADSEGATTATTRFPVTAPPVARPVGPRPPLGRLAFGALLIAAGVVWLLGALDIVDVPVQSVLPIALIAVGVALVAGARTGRHGGLLVLGTILTVVLALLASFDVRLQGGVGQKNAHPIPGEPVETDYRLSVGQLTIDLTDADLPEATTDIHARVGIGQLTVRVPRSVAVFVRGEAGAGQLRLLGREESGLNRELTVSSRPASAGAPRLRLFLTVGLGQIEVTR